VQAQLSLLVRSEPPVDPGRFRVALERLLRLTADYGVSEVDYGKALSVRGPERGFVGVFRTG
jgi:hypothetical protein